MHSAAQTASITAYIGRRCVGSLKKGKLHFSAAALGGKKFPTQEEPAWKRGREQVSQMRVKDVARLSEGEIWFGVNKDDLRMWVTIIGDSAMVETVAIGESYGEAFVCSKLEARRSWKNFAPDRVEKLS